ncbi:MAG: tetratricopeptide repeat protein [Deltaproteobacteria bacterium]|nr:tetratricopeptide repeat protein [Deltaproteobacteria bacterium]
MKHIAARMIILSLLVALLVPAVTLAASKTFVKEYTYTAGDEDSKNSSRVIALREVKRLLLEELGTYLESRTEVKNFQLTLDQITTLTAGIVQTEVIAEKWDGRSYWLRSKITADPEDVVKSIDAVRRDRDKTRELESLRQKSDELLKEVERLKKEMASNEGSRDSKKAEYDQSIRKLSAAEWIEKGHALFVPDEKSKAAFDAYSRAIELDPDNVNAYYYRAQVSEKNQAMSDYYKLLSIKPKDSEAHYARAWTYMVLDQIDPALQEFGKAIDRASLKKEKAAAYQERGRIYTLSRVVEARGITRAKAAELQIADFSSAIALDPGEAVNYSLRGGAYFDLGKYDLALQDHTAAVTIDPKNPGFYSSRADVYRMLGKRELAVADLTRAIELEGPNNILATNDYMMRAFDYEDLGKLDLAIRDWTRLLDMNPNDYSAYKQRGDLYSKIGKYDQALKDYNQSIALDPKDAAGAYYGRALVYAVKKDVGKALQDLRSAVQLNPVLKDHAISEEKFGAVRQNPEFKKLVQ